VAQLAHGYGKREPGRLHLGDVIGRDGHEHLDAPPFDGNARPKAISGTILPQSNP